MRRLFSGIGGPTAVAVVVATVITVAHGDPPAPGTEPPRSMPPDSATAQQQQRIVQLVGQLGAAAFREREAAGRELLEIGVAALPALREAVNDPNLEVKFRAIQLVRRLRAIEQHQILEAFKDDPERPPGNRLRGWRTLKSVAGDSGTTREMVVAMHEREAELFAAWQMSDKETELNANRLNQVYAQRCEELKLSSRSRGQREVNLASIATLLLIGGLAEHNTSAQTAGALMSLLQTSNVRAALNNKDARAQVLRALLARWICKPGGTSESYQKLILSMRYEIPEGREPAIRLIEAGGTGSQLQYAILAVGKLGRAEDIQYLVPLFKNKSVLSQATTRARTVYFCKVCDVALAAAIHLTGQKTEHYQFERLARNSTYLFTPNSAGFASEKQRAAAFAKWADWQAEQAAVDTPATAP